MQNIEPERQSWLKLSFLLVYIFALGLLTVLGGDDDIVMNLDNPNTIATLKIIQGLSVLVVFVFPAILFAVFWTKPRIHYLGVTTKPAITTLMIAAIGMLLAMPMINWLSDANQHLNLPEALSRIETWMPQSEEKAKILKLGYGFSLLFLLFAFSPLFIKEVKAADQFPFWPQPGYLYHFYLIFSYLGLVGYGLIKLFKDYRYLTSEPDYLKSLPRITQAKLIILATFIGFGGGAANFFLFYNIPIAPYTNILAGLGLLLMAWAIRKYSYFYIPFESGFDKVRRMYRQPYGYQIENFKTA